MSRCFIIAEIGSNWTSFEEAKDSIPVAANCGADAVKFQMFKPEEMWGPINNGQPTVSGIPSHWLPKLKEKADACGIEFMCTAFSVDGIKTVDPFVKRHKVASSDLTHAPMLRHLRMIGKPVLLSTGASGWNDIGMALNAVKGAPTTLLYCNSEYPSRWHNLRLINVLRDKFKVDVGFSSHAIDGHTPVVAHHIHGATVVEAHANFAGTETTPDHKHSLDTDLFQYMVSCIRDTNHSMKMPTPGEVDMIKKHNRRLVVTKPIKAGDLFEYDDNYGLYRTIKEDVNGYSGWYLEKVDGSKAAVDLEPGDTIGPGQVDAEIGNR